LGDRIIVLGGSPAEVVFEQLVSLEETSREPVLLRADKAFAQMFTNLWEAMTL